MTKRTCYSLPMLCALCFFVLSHGNVLHAQLHYMKVEGNLGSYNVANADNLRAAAEAGFNCKKSGDAVVRVYECDSQWANCELVGEVTDAKTGQIDPVKSTYYYLVVGCYMPFDCETKNFCTSAHTLELAAALAGQNAANAKYIISTQQVVSCNASDLPDDGKYCSCPRPVVCPCPCPCLIPPQPCCKQRCTPKCQPKKPGCLQRLLGRRRGCR